MNRLLSPQVRVLPPLPHSRKRVGAMISFTLGSIWKRRTVFYVAFVAGSIGSTHLASPQGNVI
ncbi:MAG TPA: hypothetical protein VGC53_01270, partial [Vicinamibacteria bacterium]